MPIDVKGLSYTYVSPDGQRLTALRGVELCAQRGSLLGITGRTGCGKSTLVRLMAGLLTPTEGRVLYDGEDINASGFDKSRLRRRVGVVFQNPEYQLFESSVERDVGYALRRSGLSRAEVESRVRRAIELVGLDYNRVRALSPLSLSGGEKRLAAIAGALAGSPDTLILDEPAAGLDPSGLEHLIKLLDRLRRDGTTIIMVSHNIDILCRTASDLVYLDGGCIADQGPLEQVLPRLSWQGVLSSPAQEAAALLASRGLELPEDVLTCDQLLSALIARLGRGGAA